MWYHDRVPAGDDTAPATKQDIRMIMEMIGGFMDETRGLIAESERRMKADFHAAKEEMKSFFSTGIEIVRQEVIGANADRMAQHQHRLDDHDRRMIVLEAASSRR